MASQLRFHLNERFDRRRCLAGVRDNPRQFIVADDAPRHGSLTEIALLAALGFAQFAVSLFIVSHF